MTICPNPYVLTVRANQRQAAFLAEVERDRLTQRAVGNRAPRQRRAAGAVVMAVVAALSLLLAAGSADAQDFPDAHPVQKVREAGQ